MATTAIAVAIGLVVGLALGALGGGGAVLTVPALVFLLGELPHDAATASLVIVGVSSVAGLLARARSGQVRWGAGLAFGTIGALTAATGALLARQLNPDVLLLAFAALILLAATAMLWPTSSSTAPEPDSEQAASVPSSSRDHDTRSAVSTLERACHATRYRLTQAARPAAIAAAGALVGLATGLFGVGGGFLIVPALVLTLGWSMPAATATSLLVIVVNSAAALGVRAATDPFHWSVILPVTAAAVLGTLIGQTIADRVSGIALSRAFAALLIAVAVYTATTSAITLA